LTPAGEGVSFLGGTLKEVALPRLPFLPREEKFFHLFQRSSQNLVAAAGYLSDLVNDYHHPEEKVNRIIACENYGDDLTHEVIRLLHRTFVTPLDREDIALLAQRLDDVMDFMEEATREMLDYRIEAPTQKCRELVEVIVACVAEVDRAISLLAHRRHLRQILDHGIRINSLENQADGLLRAAMAEVFADTMNLAEAMKWREIYSNLENATDRCEDVADILEGIVLKYA